MNLPRTSVRFIAVAALVTAAFGVQTAITAGPSAPSQVITTDPARILDTREALGVPAIAKVQANSSITVQVTGVGGVPVNATGVIVTLTAVNATVPTFITATPTGTPRATTSILNPGGAQAIANTVTMALGTGGKIDLYNLAGSVDLIADVSGYLVDASSLAPPGGTLTVGAYEGKQTSGAQFTFHYGCQRTQNGGELWYDVPLPAGAVITSMDLHHYDAAAGGAVTVQLWYSDWSNPSSPTNAEIANVTLADSGGMFISTAAPIAGAAPLTLPNRYYLQVEIGPSSQLMFCGADIHYTMG